ncbi:hypothetical protein Tco_0624433 [Tanacetum coccineum]|uniref:Uncharacterized protein n=1 Tax=Tanacetum coccineum TaxID=301880 RepID=A0ABQ4WDX8_9ASTR
MVVEAWLSKKEELLRRVFGFSDEAPSSLPLSFRSGVALCAALVGGVQIESTSRVQPEILKNVGKPIATFRETFKPQRAALIWVTTSAVRE